MSFYRLPVCLAVALLTTLPSVGCLVPASHGHRMPLSGGFSAAANSCGDCDGGPGLSSSCDGGCDLGCDSCQTGCDGIGNGAFFNAENGGPCGLGQRFCDRVRGWFAKDSVADVPWPRYHPVPSRPVFSGLPELPQ